MYLYTVKSGQNLLDVALQEYGSIEGIIFIMSDNGLPLSPALEPGQELIMHEEQVLQKATVQYLASRGQLIGTDTTEPVLDSGGTTGQFKEEHYQHEMFK